MTTIEAPDTTSPAFGAPYGVTQWPDVDAVAKASHDLATGSRPRLSAARLEEVDAWFEANCATSKVNSERAKTRIPGGVQHNLAFNKPFPIEVTRAEGAHLWDVDGNEYIDFIQAGGPTVLGSNHQPVREKVIEVLEQCGPVTGLYHDYEYKLASLVHDLMPSVDQFRMLASLYS